MSNIKNMKVLIAEVVDKKVVEKIEAQCIVEKKYKLSHEELLNIIPEYNAIIIRSETQINKSFLDAAVNLKIVGRAGSGLDNIDIEYATKKGVIVANTPESNIVSAAEQTMAMLLGTSRNIVWANNTIKSGKWDRKKFIGSELYEKTLGIIGLGRIGGLISERAKAFGMNLIGYDPYISDSRFEKYGVEKKNSIEELVKEADFITVHTPRTEETINIISDKEIELMKDGVRLVNVARGGLYNEEALYRGMKSGKIASVGVDVWMTEPQETHPLYEFNTMIGTPHLGASTHEAQFRVGDEVANEVLAGLKGEIVKNAVNIPSVSDSTFVKLKTFISLSEKMGKLYSQIEREGIKKICLSFGGKEISNKEDIKVLSLVAIKGILDSTVPETVNFVNANYIAKQRGIEIKESIELDTGDYNNLMRITIEDISGKEFEIEGTVLEKKYPRIVKIGEFEVDLVPEGKLVYMPHKNVPGVIGRVGIKMAEFNVNISKMIVSDSKDNGSIMILTVDNNMPNILVENLKNIDEIKDVKIINL